MAPKTTPALVPPNASHPTTTNGGGELSPAPPSPEARKRIVEELEAAGEAVRSLPGAWIQATRPTTFGFDDGLIIPGSEFPLGTPPSVIRNAAADRAPLRGAVRVIVVMVDFSDKKTTTTKPHIEDLFFSEGKIPTGSVREYYKEASHSLIDIQGAVVGPLELPQTMAYYANKESGMGPNLPNGRTMARDAVKAADATVDFGPYDNDGNGFVDAFIVVHAGQGAEVTLNADDIWSHKSVLEGEPYVADSTKVYGYLTVPEDAKLGVCAHELGHLLFGWPDLYDTDHSSEGIGDWCLMAAGTWNDAGNRPAHPSAWCKMNQGWVSVANQTANAVATINEVKSSHVVHRLWYNGGASQEYYLLENRQKTGFDDHLPAPGLLIWRIDDAVKTGNTNENHPLVALVQADGLRQLEQRLNHGDPGDPYPGSTANRKFDEHSTPSSNAYAGLPTCVAVSEISDAGSSMTARLSVSCAVKTKETKDVKETKETKETKEGKETKDVKETKEAKETKEKESKELIKDALDTKPKKITDHPKSAVIDKLIIEKGVEKIPEAPGGMGGQPAEGGPRGEIEARLAQIEAALGRAEPFISGELRPDLEGGAFLAEGGIAAKDQERLDDPFQKRLLDVPPAIG